METSTQEGKPLLHQDFQITWKRTCNPRTIRNPRFLCWCLYPQYLLWTKMVLRFLSQRTLQKKCRAPQIMPKLSILHWITHQKIHPPRRIMRFHRLTLRHSFPRSSWNPPEEKDHWRTCINDWTRKTHIFNPLGLR